MNPKDVVAWFAWYADGTRWTSADVEWEHLPPSGILGALLVFRDGTTRIESGNDFYWKQGDVYGHGDDARAVLQRFREVKFGSWVTDQQMQDVNEAMMATIKGLKKEPPPGWCC